MLMCDVCETQIDEPTMAMVRWHRPEERREGTVIENLTYCHKGQCDKTLNEENPEDQWWELSHFFARPLLSTGMTVPTVERAIEDVGALQDLP